MDRKSTFGGCQFLGCSLVSWSSKKQSCVSLSSTEAEYVAAGSCCAQLLWMRQTLKEYGVICDKVPLWCDNESAIKISLNPVQHFKTKHIEIRYHFIREHIRRGEIELNFFGVTMKVPSRSLSTRCNTSRQSILRSGITSSGSTLGEERSSSTMSTLMITLQIFSRSPWMKQDFVS